MAGGIEQAAAVSDRFTSRPKTAALLQRLVADSRDVQIVSAACFDLAEFYYGQYACLSVIADQARFPAEMRRRAEQMLAIQQTRNAELRGWLSTFPLQACSKAPFPDSLYRVHQELEMLLSDPDPSIKVLACRALRANYPDQEPRCNSK
jgi:hypothetical protein